MHRAWFARRTAGGNQTDGGELADEATCFLAALRQGVEAGQFDDIAAAGWASTREVLEAVSRVRGQRGSTPTETATFVFSRKRPVFELLRRQTRKDGDNLADETGTATPRL